jgi:hypothetical protein
MPMPSKISSAPNDLARLLAVSRDIVELKFNIARQMIEL